MTRVILEVDSSEKLSKIEMFAKQEDIRIIECDDGVKGSFKRNLEKIKKRDHNLLKRLAQ